MCVYHPVLYIRRVSTTKFTHQFNKKSFFGKDFFLFQYNSYSLISLCLMINYKNTMPISNNTVRILHYLPSQFTLESLLSLASLKHIFYSGCSVYVNSIYVVYICEHSLQYKFSCRVNSIYKINILGNVSVFTIAALLTDNIVLVTNVMF